MIERTNFFYRLHTDRVTDRPSNRILNVIKHINPLKTRNQIRPRIEYLFVKTEKSKNTLVNVDIDIIFDSVSISVTKNAFFIEIRFSMNSFL